MEPRSGFSSRVSSPKLAVISSLSTTPLFKLEGFLKQKYHQERLSARQIAVLIRCSHSVVNSALIRFGIKKLAQSSGWIEYGWKLKFGRRVPHRRQQIIIRQISNMRKRGWTYQRIAQKLNDRKIPAPQGLIWYSSTISKILKRWESSPGS